MTCPFTTDSPCSGDLAPLRIPELERAAKVAFSNTVAGSDIEAFSLVGRLNALLDLPGMFLLVLCSTCNGTGLVLMDKALARRGFRFNSSCPDCESGYRKALVCERHRGMLTGDSVQDGQVWEPKKVADTRGDTLPHTVSDVDGPICYLTGPGGYASRWEVSNVQKHLDFVPDLTLPPSLYQEPNRVLARELGIEVAA